jgi:EmrB/QacA subfamily drug resistance transporter
MVLLNITVVNVNLPDIQRSLRTDSAGLEWIVNAYNLSLVTLLIAGGTLGDIYGRKRVFLTGLAVFLVGSVICTQARSTEILLVGRVLQGAGAATVQPNSLAIITQTFADPAARARAIGVWSGVNGLALGSGPLIGGFLGSRFGWPSIFAVNIPIGLLAIAASLWILVEVSADPEARRSLDPRGQLLTIVWVAALTFGLIEGNALGWQSPIVLGSLLLAAAGFAAFVGLERSEAHPMVPLWFFRNPKFVAANTVGFAMFFGYQGGVFFLSLFFQEVQGASSIDAGFKLTPLNAAFIVITPLAGALAARFGPRLPLVMGSVIAGSGFLLLYNLEPSTGYGTSWWRLVLFGVGFALALPPMVAAVLATVPAGRAGAAAAVHNAVRQFGGLVGVAVMGLIAGARPGAALPTAAKAAFTSGIASALVTAGILSLIAAAVAFFFVRTSPVATPRSELLETRD